VYAWLAKVSILLRIIHLGKAIEDKKINLEKELKVSKSIEDIKKEVDAVIDGDYPSQYIANGRDYGQYIKTAIKKCQDTQGGRIEEFRTFIKGRYPLAWNRLRLTYLECLYGQNAHNGWKALREAYLKLPGAVLPPQNGNKWILPSNCSFTSDGHWQLMRLSEEPVSS
jgi:hypothetical protein